MSIELNVEQADAVELICSAPIGVVTGGAGTGKTTCLRTALDRLDDEGVDYALASPTGKAAKRMQEATGRDASTIHRLLKYTPSGFLHTRSEPLDCALVVVDEASMVDVELMDALLDAIDPTATRLILMGDAQQLPSVGPGRVLADLIDSGLVPVVRLVQVHRAAAESWVATQAPRVLLGERLDLRERDDFVCVFGADMERLAKAVVERMEAFESAGIDAQVLVPQRTTALGVDELNRRLQLALNGTPGPKAWKIGAKHKAFAGDRVIQTKNDYTRGVFNGEVGVVVGLERIEGVEVLVVDFDGRQVSYAREAAGALQLAYALTIHKSQGSEWPWVIVVCHQAHTYMLSRQLLYTGLTRAKKGVVLVGDQAGLDRALKDASPAKRNTELAERLREAV